MAKLVNHVRSRRVALGLSQAELAARTGVSRQALGAIEAGRQVPATTLALALARALQTGVEALFVLAGGPVIHARLGSALAGTRRVVLGRVEGQLVAHPARDEAHAADGVVLGELGSFAAGEDVAVECLDEARVEANVLVAGCAPLLGVLADRVGRRHRDARATWIPANSGRALELLAAGLVHVAGVHLADASDPQANVRATRGALPERRASLVNLARWRQGLVVAAGNPEALALGSELLRPGLRYAAREPGAAAQQVLERVLARAGGLEPGACADQVQARDHAEVARLVRWGIADLGVAIEAAALAEGLDFIPLSEERFDLIVPASGLDNPAVVRVLELIDRPAFRTEAARLRGYDLSLAGVSSTIEAH